MKYYIEFEECLVETGNASLKAVEELVRTDYANKTLRRIVPQKGHHICRYCYGVADGEQSDILCEECREVFGHTFYSEL